MISRQQAENDFLADYFANADKMVAGGKETAQRTIGKMANHD